MLLPPKPQPLAPSLLPCKGGCWYPTSWGQFPSETETAFSCKAGKKKKGKEPLQGCKGSLGAAFWEKGGSAALQLGGSRMGQAGTR